MVDACLLLGVDVMTGHWEFMFGHERVKEVVEKDFTGENSWGRKIDFVAQNVIDTEWGEKVFEPYVIREINQQGKTVFLVEQNIPRIAELADRVYVMDHGHIVHEGTAADLLADDARREHLLGI